MKNTRKRKTSHGVLKIKVIKAFRHNKIDYILFSVDSGFPIINKKEDFIETYPEMK